MHAIGEVLQGLRNQSLDAADLIRFGHPLSLVEMTATKPQILDLCDPGNLQKYDIRPDSLASWDFTKTQSIARRIFHSEYGGFRWWSSLSGDWHSTILFHTRLDVRDLVCKEPVALTLDHPALLEVMKKMSIRLSPVK